MDVALTVLYTDSKTVTSIYSKHNYTYTITMNVCDDNVGCNEVKNVMCFTTIPTLFVYFLYDHIPTFFYIFPEMFFITCTYIHITFYDPRCDSPQHASLLL